jgi:hypothetical protein
VLARAEYAVLLPAGVSARAAAARYAEDTPLWSARREREDSRRSAPAERVDVRRSLAGVEVADGAQARRLADELGWDDAANRAVVFGVVVSALGSARPVEVVEALSGPEAAVGSRIARLGLWAAGDGALDRIDPLDVERLRARILSVEAAPAGERAAVP